MMCFDRKIHFDMGVIVPTNRARSCSRCGVRIGKSASNTKQLGQRMLALRKQRGLTQAKLAELADVHLNLVGNVELAA